jgi:hypothetical protein
MSTLQAFRQHPAFSDLFDEVYPLCWPILLWQLLRFFAWTRAEGIPEGWYSVNRWGFLTVHLLGDKADPSAYKPIERTFRPLTDASYASDLPACLEVFGVTAMRALILPRAAGGGGMAQSAMTEGALTSPLFDST